MLEKWKLERAPLICVLLVASVATIYLPAVFLDFTNYDDPYYVTENPHVRAGINWSTLGWALTHTCTGNWHPVTVLSHALDCQIYGLNPAGHHLTNVIFHAANTIILFLLLRALTGVTWRSAAVAALFASHPLRIESVAWISERKDVLSMFFGLLSLWAYVQYARKDNDAAERKIETPNSKLEANSKSEIRTDLQYYFLSLALFLAGLMSKPMLVTWPCVMLLLDYWPLKRIAQAFQNGFSILRLRRLLIEKIPFFVLSAASCVVTFFVQKGETAVAPLQDISLGARALNALAVYAQYIEKSIWPVNLAPIYPYVQNWSAPAVLTAAALIGALTAAAIWQRERRPYLLAGWLWYLGTLVPVIGLVQVGNQSMADRYTYIPGIGLLIMLVWTATDLIKGHTWRRVSVIAASAVFIASAVVAQRQLMYWQNTETLFRHTLAVTDKNYIAWNSLGFYFAERREAKEAERCFRAALAISPNNIYSLNRLATVLIDQGRYDEAVADAKEALQLNPRMAAAYRTLGFALMKLGRTNDAIGPYEEALRLEPDNAPEQYNLANALARQGQFEKAREHYQEAVRLEPGSADAHNNLAYMLVREGKVEEAIGEFRAALQLRPDSWHARFGLGDALAREGKLAEAADELLQVVKAQPKLAAAQMQLNRIAWFLATYPERQGRDGKKALEAAERLCELTAYKNPVMVETLAAAQAELGQFVEATDSAERARSLAVAAGQDEIARKAEELGASFREGKPYREKGMAGAR